MKKIISTFLTLWSWAFILCCSGQAFAQQSTDSITLKFGGYAEYLSASATPIITTTPYNVWGFNLNTKDSYLLGGSLDQFGRSWLDVAPDKRLFIKTGIWIDNKWLVYTAFDLNDKDKEVNEGDVAYYFFTDPTQGKIELVGNGFASRAFYPNGMAYNAIDKKLYGVQENKLLQMSLSDTSISQIATLFYKNEDGANTDAKPFNTIVCNLQGELFGVDVDHVFCKINSTTGEINKIGALGIASTSQKISTQGLVCDPRNGNIYFMNSSSTNKRYVHIVNTSTGVAKAINTTTIPQMKAWFLHYYTKNCIPGDPTDVNITSDAENPLKTLITAKVNTLNFNGETQEDHLEKVYLYRRIPATENWDLVDSIKNPKPGQSISFANTVPKAGVYEYGIRIKTNTELYSQKYEGGRSFNYQISLPFTTGLENEDINSPFTEEGVVSWQRKDIGATAHGGKYVYYRENIPLTVSEEPSLLVFNGLPVNKGGKYELSFWVRKAPGGNKPASQITLLINNTKVNAKLTDTSTWHNFVYSWQSTKTENFSFSFSAVWDYGFYLDDISVIQTATHLIPDTAKIISAIPAPLGEQAVHVKWQNPGVSSGGQALNQNDNYGVIIQAVSSKSNTATIYQTDTLKNRIIGSLDSIQISSPRSGKLYYRIRAFNAHGFSPYTTVSEQTNWIGHDTIAAPPTNFKAEITKDNKVKLSWDQSDKGKNGGYFKYEIKEWNLTYYKYKLPSGTPVNKITKIVNDKFYIADDIDDLDVYCLELFALVDQTNKKSTSVTTYSVGGLLKDNHLVANITSPVTTQNYPLMVFAPALGNKNTFNSVVTQQVYNKEQLQENCVIDTLYLFLPNPAKTIKLDLPYKIYLGYKTNSPFFQDDNEKVSIEDPLSKEVFNDTIRIDPSLRVLKIPITPFYYDGSGSLAMTVIRKWSSTSVNLPIYNAATPEGQLGLWGKWRLNDKEDLIDYDTISNLLNLPPPFGSKALHSVLMIHKIPNLSTVKGNVKSLRSGKVIPGAQINIKPVVNGSAPVDIITAVNNDSSTGNYSFNQLFAVQYEIRIAALGYVDTTLILTVEANKTYEFNAVLDDAQKIDISGKVVNIMDQPMSAAKVEISGISKDTTSTNEQGHFNVDNLYGKTSYELIIKKPLYQTYKNTIVVNDSDTTLGEIVLTCEPYVPFNLNAEVFDQKQANLNWTKPISGTYGEKKAKWCLDSCDNGFSSSNFTACKGAIRFTPAQMKEKGINGKGLKTIRVYLYDASCKYSIMVYQGVEGNTEIYNQKIGHRKPGWYEFELPSILKIDSTQDLYLALDAPMGYQGYPIPTDEGPNVGEGTSVVQMFSTEWRDMSNFAINIDANISIEGIFAYPSEVTPLNGYQVFRANALRGSEVIPNEEISSWDKISTTNITDLKFTDPTYSALPLGVYKYMIKADYKNILSNPSYSNPVYNNIQYNVNIKFEDTLKSQINLKFTPKDGNKDHIYMSSSKKGEEIVVNQVWRGEYKVEITRTYSQPIVLNVSILKDTTLTIPAFDQYISDPQIISTLVRENTAIMNYSFYSKESYYDDFESYEDFAISDLGPFSLSDPVLKYGLDGYVWKNRAEAQSWIVMNPKKTQPSITISAFLPMEGENKYLFSMRAVEGNNNDCIIFPLNTTKGGVLSFFANGIGADGELEKMSVRYSSTGSNNSDFKPVGEGDFQEVTRGWKEYSYNIPENAKYVAIVNVSDKVFALMIDKFNFCETTQGKPHSFDIYLNGNKVKREAFTSTQYTFANLTSGTHKLGLKAIFNTGESSLVEQEITVNANEKENTLAGIQVGPNPTTGLCTVDVSQSCNLDILTGQGSLLKTMKLNKASHEIDLKSLPAGVYFFKFTNSTDTYSIKVVKL